mgnify:CR=1 FL=1
MKTITTSIEINAPIEKVWNALMAFDQWNGWNPISKAKGKAYLDEEILLTMKVTQDNKKEMNYKATVVELEPTTYFRFRAKMMAGFMFTNDKIFELSQEGDVTTLKHTETFSGLMVKLFWKKLETGVPVMLDATNEALKAKLES